jgi:hypothetical protein
VPKTCEFCAKFVILVSQFEHAKNWFFTFHERLKHG